MAVDFRTAKVDSEPTWEIAYLFPSQGAWSEPEYLGLQTNRCVEYSDGNLEVLAMPGERHQRIVLFLLQLLAVHVHSLRLGTVLMAPFPVRLWPGKFREPDI
ncbi:MAG: Uma2 family endonuclease, partial [Caldilinea sp.]|nr:Uma2 family endonuclease [Caldilinea sp.]